MNVLVTVASKHGSTAEIGAAIAEVLRESGIDVDDIRPERVSAPVDYDAVICGSAIYMGRWLGSARDLINENADALRERPVWLFSSGPLKGADDPADSAEGRKLLALIGGREHRLFPGKVDKDAMGFGERTILRMVKSPDGDYRNWDDIKAWAATIATELKAVPVGVS